MTKEELRKIIAQKERKIMKLEKDLKRAQQVSFTTALALNDCREQLQIKDQEIGYWRKRILQKLLFHYVA